jgi:sec-independent protein translocase protein TatB
MLPGLGFTEMMALAVLALLVVGPKDLPLMLRKLGRFMAKVRSMANEFRSGMDELARQAELDELKREVEAMRKGQVFEDIHREVTRPIALDSPDPSPPTAPPEVPPNPETPEPIEPDTPPVPAPPTPPVTPPAAPPGAPPISPPAPSGPEPITAGARR